jgi:hypothetical protein
MEMNPKKVYLMKGEEVVELTVQLHLSHMELLLCSGVSLQLLKISLYKTITT